MRLLICGDRNRNRPGSIYQLIAGLNPRPECIIEGEARGADRLARDVAETLGIPVLAFPADWEKYGKAAGPIRNQQMLDEGNPTHVWAFHADIENSRGTKDMINRAKKAGLPTLIFEI